jgi:REP element-mobilizing transposase RayT
LCQNFIVIFYRRNLPHLQRDYKPHFVTFVTKLRWNLPDRARDITLDCCLHDHESKYRLHVAVVMPDHVHLILTPMTDETRRLIVSLVEIMKAIKGASSHAIKRRLGHQVAVWQEESFDRVLRSSENLDAKIDYVLQNPGRAGLVQDWRKYRWLWRRPSESPYAPLEKRSTCATADAPVRSRLPSQIT